LTQEDEDFATDKKEDEEDIEQRRFFAIEKYDISADQSDWDL
jgi:hypothetical protein